MKNWYHFIILFIFLLFAGVQFNDPDPLLWVLLYLQVAISSLFYITKKRVIWWPVLGILSGIAGFIFLFPEFNAWINEGMPTITGSMKAENPHIEFIREFFGYVLILLFSIYYFIKLRRI